MNDPTAEIQYREAILQKARENIKITPQEREWLVTHPSYNKLLGYPYLNIAIEKIIPEKWYSLKITVEDINYDKKINPVISVPAMKGEIICDFELIDYNGNVSKGKPVKMLGFEINCKKRQYEVRYKSKLGLLSVFYECDYFDEKQNLHMRQSSFGGNPAFAMEKHIVSDCITKFCCKVPGRNSFDAMVFTVEKRIEE